MRRMNPHKEDAVTADTVQPGDHLLVWQPNVPGSDKKVTITSPIDTDTDGTLVVEAIVEGQGHTPSTHACSVLGLTSNRSGKWTHVAIYDYTAV